MSLATAIHGSTTLASFETTRWFYLLLVLLYVALLFRGNLAVKLALLIGGFMGVLLPAFAPDVNSWTAGFPSKHLGSGPGLTVTFILVIAGVLAGILYYLEHTRAGRERGSGAE